MDTSNLICPEGWTEKFCKKKRKKIYVNKLTGSSSFVCPSQDSFIHESNVSKISISRNSSLVNSCFGSSTQSSLSHKMKNYKENCLYLESLSEETGPVIPNLNISLLDTTVYHSTDVEI